jgi:hypothetical protein
VLVLALPRALIDSAVPAVQRHLARRPDAWHWVAARGKVRRFAGVRLGLADLERAGDTYLQVFDGRNPDLLTAMNLYRLAGAAATGRLLERLRRETAAYVAEWGHDAVRTGPLIDACFLQGDDERVQSLLAEVRAVDPDGVHGTRYEDVARLARARAARDVAECDTVVDAFDAAVALEADSFSGTGGMNHYDWLEIALVVRSEIAGEVSPRLFQL